MKKGTILLIFILFASIFFINGCVIGPPGGVVTDAAAALELAQKELVCCRKPMKLIKK